MSIYGKNTFPIYNIWMMTNITLKLTEQIFHSIHWPYNTIALQTTKKLHDDPWKISKEYLEEAEVKPDEKNYMAIDHLALELIVCKAAFNTKSRRISICVKGTLPTINIPILFVHYVSVASGQVHIKELSTQRTPQQQHAKPRHQPSDRDQQARDRLRNKVSKSKAKIKSRAYLQLGTKTLQIVHQIFDPDLPVILHLPALTTTTDTDTIPTLFVIQEGRHCMPTTYYYFMNIQPDPITIPPPPPHPPPPPQRK